ncbi:ANTAR domain-containing protein [Nonomuraea polychroma]|uniref:ANTAR domain-containing protein n=1 Tax=Nonomuraea polychroma TaxID=46176 RepID=UPI000FDDEA2C|nr:ANTAR domain-containing protein [Nonomuraea polychroma]
MLTADLRQADQQARWPVLTAMPQAARVRAVFAFPMLTGSLVAGSPTDSVAVGVLVLCPVGPRTLSPAEQRRAQLFADAALILLLGLVTHDGGGGAVVPFDALTLTAHIHQASGVVAVQLGCSPDQALLRLRAYAFAGNEPLSQVADRVLAHTLRFSRDRPA